MIRKLERKDHENFLSMIDEFYHSPAVLHCVDTKNYDITFERCIVSDPYTDCFVYEEGGFVKGYVLLSFAYSNEVGGIVVWIEELYVSEKWRNAGIGKALMEFVHDKYKDSAKRFRLEATHDNLGAIKLYKSYGYDTLDYLQMTKDI